MLHECFAFFSRLSIASRSWASQMDCVISTLMNRVLLFMEASKAWVYLSLNQMFDSMGPHNRPTFWSPMVDMRSLLTLVPPALLKHLLA